MIEQLWLCRQETSLHGISFINLSKLNWQALYEPSGANAIFRAQRDTSAEARASSSHVGDSVSTDTWPRVEFKEEKIMHIKKFSWYMTLKLHIMCLDLPLLLDQTEAWRKFFLRPCPPPSPTTILISGSGWPGLPYLKVWTRHCIIGLFFEAFY